MAQKKLTVPVVADSSAFKRGLSESEQAANEFEKKIKTTTSSVRTHILGLGAAFIGVGGFVEGVKKSVEAAVELDQATSQMDAQFKANGESAKAYTAQIQLMNTHMERVGFTNTQSEEAFSRLSRAAGSSSIAMKYMGETADLAASKHVALSAAALLVGKVINGSTSALNRYGIIIPKGTSATEALAIAQKKLTGQAAAMAKPTEVFSTIITDLEAKIGKELLPTIDKYMSKIEVWIGKSDNQRKITDTVTSAVKGLSQVIEIVVPWIEKGWHAAQSFSDTMGGFKNTVVALTTAWAGYKVGLGLVSVAQTVMGATGVGALTAIKGALISTGIGAAFVGLGLAAGYVITHWKQVKEWFTAFIDDIEKMFGTFVTKIGDLLSKIPSWLPGVGKFHAWGEDLKTWGGTLGQQVGQNMGWAIGLSAAQAMKQATADALKNGTGVTYGPGGSPGNAMPGSSGYHAPGGSGSVSGKSLAGENPNIAKGLDAVAAAGYNVNVTSGRRSYAQQAALYARYVASGFNNQYIAAKPGQSNHETGNAVDAYVNGKPVDQVPGALAILKKYGLVADVAGDHEHLDYRAPGSTGGGGGGGGGPLPGDAAAAAAAAKKAAAAAKAAATAAYKSWKENYFTPLDNQYKSDMLITDESKRLNALEALHAKLAIDLKNSTGKEHQDILNEEDKVQSKITSLKTKEHNAALAMIAKEKAAYVAGLQAQQTALTTQMSGAQAELSKQQTAFDRAYTLIADKVRNTFNTTTQAGLDAITAKYATTPEEQAAAAFQAQLDGAQKAADLASAQGDLVSAQMSGDPAAVQAAQAALDNVQNQQKLADLQTAAAASRVVADKAAAAETQTYNDARSAQLQNLNDWLDDQKTSLEAGTETWDQFWAGAFSDAPAKYAPDAVSSLQGVLDQMQAIANLQGQIDANSAALGSGKAPSISLAGGLTVGAGVIGAGFGGAFANPGAGTVSKPTWFLAGEAGQEDYAFSGAGKSFGGGCGGGPGPSVTLQVGPVFGAIDQPTARLWAATLKAELDRLIKL